MSQIVIAHPFSAEQLNGALRTFMSNTDTLGWVGDKVLRNRVQVEREQVAKAEEATAAAKAALAVAEARLEAAERIADRRKMERMWVSRNLARANDERDTARAELARLKDVMERALGHETFRAHAGGGDAA